MRKYTTIVSGILVLFGLYLTSLYSFLLFHSLVELFSIVVACGIFIIAWNSRRFMDNTFLLFIGIAYLFIGGLDLIHTLGYPGMSVFQGYGTTLSTQLWIATRYLESLSLLIAFFFLSRRMRPNLVFLSYTAIVSLVLVSIFYWNVFPLTFVEGVGLTPFKKVSEYIISLILLGSLVLLLRKRREFDRGVLRLLVAAIIMTIGAELFFTFYISAYGFSNLAGHFLKLISFYLIYKALVETGLTKPYNLLFRNLKQNEEQLEQANIHLQEVDRLKSVFLASMSHELRTPLNSIIGFTGIILQGMSGEVTEEQRKQLTMVKNSASHLLSLINDILDISKVEAEKAELSLEEFSLDGMMREVVEPLSSVASEKGLELVTDVPEGVTLFSDKRRVKQVLMNLVSNAVKFTDQGSVKITARVPEDDNLEIRVIDTGIGIKEEDMEKLFQPFQQIDVSLTKKHEGTGLGLYLSKKLAGLLGSNISAKSEYGRGSEFTFTIPLKYEG